MQRRLWDKEQKYSRELTLTLIRRKENKSMKTTSLGRNVSSRESEVTDSKPTGFWRKSRQSL